MRNKDFSLFCLLFGSWLILGLWSYAYDQDDPYVAGLTSFLCFAFCFILMLMLILTCQPDVRSRIWHITQLKTRMKPGLVFNHGLRKAVTWFYTALGTIYTSISRLMKAKCHSFVLIVLWHSYARVLVRNLWVFRDIVFFQIIFPPRISGGRHPNCDINTSQTQQQFIRRKHEKFLPRRMFWTSDLVWNKIWSNLNLIFSWNTDFIENLE